MRAPGLRFLWLIAALALAPVLSGTPALSAPLDDALARLSADSFSETEKAIAEIAASGGDVGDLSEPPAEDVPAPEGEASGEAPGAEASPAE